MLFDDGHSLRQIGASKPPGLTLDSNQKPFVFTQPPPVPVIRHGEPDDQNAANLFTLCVWDYTHAKNQEGGAYQPSTSMHIWCIPITGAAETRQLRHRAAEPAHAFHSEHSLRHRALSREGGAATQVGEHRSLGRHAPHWRICNQAVHRRLPGKLETC